MLQGLLRLGVCEIGAAAGFEGAGHIRPLDFGGVVKTQEHVGDICLWPAPNRQITEASFWFENASPELASAVRSNLTLQHLENWIVWRAGPGHCPVDGQSISIKALLSTPLLLLRANKLCSSADKRACCCEGWNEQRLAVATQSLEFEKDK